MLKTEIKKTQILKKQLRKCIIMNTHSDIGVVPLRFFQVLSNIFTITSHWIPIDLQQESNIIPHFLHATYSMCPVMLNNRPHFTFLASLLNW